MRLSNAILAGTLLAASFAMGGCQKPAATAAGQNAKYAGLEEAILGWRTELTKSAKECPVGPDGHGCQTFEVGCKGERDPSAGETARVVVAMSWEAWNPKRNEYQPASGLAQFTKSAGQWKRKDLPGPVNLSTCATSADQPKA